MSEPFIIERIMGPWMVSGFLFIVIHFLVQSGKKKKWWQQLLSLLIAFSVSALLFRRLMLLQDFYYSSYEDEPVWFNVAYWVLGFMTAGGIPVAIFIKIDEMVGVRHGRIWEIGALCFYFVFWGGVVFMAYIVHPDWLFWGTLVLGFLGMVFIKNDHLESVRSMTKFLDRTWG